MAEIKLVEVDEVPLCPYCEKDLNEIKVNSKQAPWSVVKEMRNVCFCPHCRKLLGVSFTRSVL